MVIDQHAAPGEPLRTVGLLADKASRLVQMVAVPSLVQLVMRVALAVPFWKFRHPQMERLSEAQRHGGDAVHRRVHAAFAGWALPLSGAGRDGVPLRLR